MMFYIVKSCRCRCCPHAHWKMRKALLTRAQTEILCHFNDALRCEDKRVVADVARMHERCLKRYLRGHMRKYRVTSMMLYVVKSCRCRCYLHADSERLKLCDNRKYCKIPKVLITRARTSTLCRINVFCLFFNVMKSCRCRFGQTLTNGSRMWRGQTKQAADKKTFRQRCSVLHPRAVGFQPATKTTESITSLEHTFQRGYIPPSSFLLPATLNLRLLHSSTAGSIHKKVSQRGVSTAIVVWGVRTAIATWGVSTAIVVWGVRTAIATWGVRTAIATWGVRTVIVLWGVRTVIVLWGVTAAIVMWGVTTGIVMWLQYRCFCKSVELKVVFVVWCVGLLLAAVRNWLVLGLWLSNRNNIA